MEEQLLGLLSARRRHFLLESGHHGNLWLDLDTLFLRPAALRPFTNELARRLGGHGVEAVVGPLVGGAFVAEMVAADLGVRFAFAERLIDSGSVTYVIPDVFTITCAVAPLRSWTMPSMPVRQRARPTPRSRH